MKEFFIQNSTLSGSLKGNRFAYQNAAPDGQKADVVDPSAQEQSVDTGQKFETKILTKEVDGDVKGAVSAGNNAVGRFDEAVTEPNPERDAKMVEINKTLDALKNVKGVGSLGTAAHAMPTRDLEWTNNALKAALANPDSAMTVLSSINKRLKENQAYAKKPADKGEAIAQAETETNPALKSKVSKMGILPALKKMTDEYSKEKKTAQFASNPRRGRKQ